MITSIKLDRFKCFAAPTTIPMSQITVLYGKNGRGKSSVIQSLLLLSQSLNENGGAIDPLVISGKIISLGSFSDIMTQGHQLSEDIVFEISTDQEKPLCLSYVGVLDKPTIARLDDLTVGDVSYRSSHDSETVSSNNPGSVNRSFLPQSDIKVYSFLRSLSFISAERRGPRNYENRKDNLSYRDVDVKGEYLINALSNQSPSFIQRFSEELSLVLSGASVRVNANIDTPDRVDLFLDSTSDNSKGYRPTNVGFGYSYVLPIIFKTMTAPEGGLVIIENPEAHLYPGAQSRLMDFLVKYATKNKLQLLLETHSDHIINGLRLAVKDKRVLPNATTILFFNRDSNSTGTPIIECIQMNEKGSLSNQPEDFMDEWTRQLLALI